MSVLLEGIDQDVEVIALDEQANSVEKINEILMRPELQRLDILAHGEPGAVLLGGQRLDSLSWPSQISASHSSNRETPLQINFWSCRTGEGETGMKFINTVAQTSNAFVNSASGFVGHSELGGSWDLDVSAKPVAPFSVQARGEFRQVLDTNGSSPLSVEDFTNLSPSELPTGNFVIRDTPYALADFFI